MNNHPDQICPKCHVESFTDGQCRYCDFDITGRRYDRFNEEAAARPFARCPSCLSYSGSDTECVYCAYPIHAFDYEKFGTTPLLEFVRLFNQKQYKASVFSLQQHLAVCYDKHLHDTLVFVRDMYFYGIAPLRD